MKPEDWARLKKIVDEYGLDRNSLPPNSWRNPWIMRDYHGIGTSLKEQKGTTMKIQVNRPKLIAALETKATELREEASLKGMVATYEKQVNQFCEILKKRVETLKACATTKELADAKEPMFNREDIKGIAANEVGSFGPYLPDGHVEAVREKDLKQLESSLKCLKLSDQDTVELDDTSDYIKFL